MKGLQMNMKYVDERNSKLSFMKSYSDKLNLHKKKKTLISSKSPFQVMQPERWDYTPDL